jgi:glycosyltransferase involved in cell wall biosynthesis
MRIAQVAPLVEAVPPRLYGGTERVVSWLTEELVRQGHDVTLFASGDSETSAELVATVPKGLRLSGISDHIASHIVMLEEVRRRADDFDVIHFHIDLLQFPLFRDLVDKCLTTLHGRLDLPDIHPVFRTFPRMPLVSISNQQREPMPPGLNWAATVYHGMPGSECPFDPRGGDYLAFLGRISPEKRPDRAIEIAKRAGLPLRIAAKVDEPNRAYFEGVVKPLLDEPLVDFVGEIGEHEKGDFLGGALALLFPVDWPEPFGLAMIESMSTGTPVIGWRCGSVPEIVDDGVTGFVVDSLDDAVVAVKHAQEIDRVSVRRRFDERFTIAHMANAYLEVFNRRMLRQDRRAETGLAAPRARKGEVKRLPGRRFEGATLLPGTPGLDPSTP